MRMCSTYTDHGEEMLSSGGGGDSNVPHFAVFVIAKIKGRKAFSRLFVLPLRNPPPPLTKHLTYGTILLYQYVVRGGVAVRGNSELRVQTDLPTTCPDPIPISKGGEYEICSSV